MKIWKEERLDKKMQKTQAEMKHSFQSYSRKHVVFITVYGKKSQQQHDIILCCFCFCIDSSRNVSFYLHPGSRLHSNTPSIKIHHSWVRYRYQIPCAKSETKIESTGPTPPPWGGVKVKITFFQRFIRIYIIWGENIFLPQFSQILYKINILIYFKRAKLQKSKLPHPYTKNLKSRFLTTPTLTPWNRVIMSPIIEFLY